MRGCLPTLTALLIAAPAFAGELSSRGDPASKGASEAPRLERFMPEQQVSKGAMTIAGKRLDYNAYAGTLVVHLKDWDDVRQNANKEDKSGRPKHQCFTSRTPRAAHNTRIGRSLSCLTVDRDPRLSGCTWGRSVRDA